MNCEHPAQDIIEFEGSMYWACTKCGENFGQVDVVDEENSD